MELSQNMKVDSKDKHLVSLVESRAHETAPYGSHKSTPFMGDFSFPLLDLGSKESVRRLLCSQTLSLTSSTKLSLSKNNFKSGSSRSEG